MSSSLKPSMQCEPDFTSGAGCNKAPNRNKN
jgi:hypothetical protein